MAIILPYNDMKYMIRYNAYKKYVSTHIYPGNPDNEVMSLN